MPSTLTVDESRALLALCRRGRLYDIDDWIKAGKSLKVAQEIRKTPIQVAIETGFHSLIELLARNESQIRIKNCALADAVSRHRMDFVELLVKHGAEIYSMPLADVLLAWEPNIIRFFLDRGADVISDRPFARAFGERVRSCLRIFREYKESHPDLADELNQQAESALRHFSYEGNLKWVSLLLWVGADPRRKGPRWNSHWEDDPECDSTAVEEACLSGNLDVMRRFKIRADTDDLSHLLNESASFAHADLTRYLLGLGAKPNDKSNGGSSALDRCLWHIRFESIEHISSEKVIRRYNVYRTMETITLLLDGGALWRPDDVDSIRRLRRTLLKAEPELVLDLFGLLKRHEACSFDTIRDFLTTPAMRKHLAGKDWHLTRLGIHNRTNGVASVPRTLLARFDREKLHEEVWSQPLWKLAPTYGVSDVALAKTCRKLKIPLPGRGYWAQLAAGKLVKKRPTLPVFPTPMADRAR
jgi:hypothetical protein